MDRGAGSPERGPDRALRFAGRPPQQDPPEHSNGFAVSIEAGCNGIEAAIVLIAAMLAFPAPWKHRLVGILVGLAAVQALNVVRVISLFYLGQWNMKAFEWAHLYLWQALIMLDVLIVWLVWIRTLPPRPAGLARQEAAA